MMHVPIWRTGNFKALVRPYLTILLPGLICFFGVVGLLETFHFIAERSVGESHMQLFGVNWAVDSVWPWLVFGLLAVGGFVACRKIAPTVLDAFETASAKAYGLID